MTVLHTGEKEFPFITLCAGECFLYWKSSKKNKGHTPLLFYLLIKARIMNFREYADEQ